MRRRPHLVGRGRCAWVSAPWEWQEDPRSSLAVVEEEVVVWGALPQGPQAVGTVSGQFWRGPVPSWSVVCSGEEVEEVGVEVEALAGVPLQVLWPPCGHQGHFGAVAVSLAGGEVGVVEAEALAGVPL